MEVRSYSSLEEMQAELADAETEANANASAVQRVIGWGDAWMTYVRDEDLWVFGKIQTRDEANRSELEAGATTSEAAYADRSLAEAHERGYRFGTAYSVLCPDGELGSTHIASMLCKLSAEQLDAAREAGWSFDELSERGHDVLSWLTERLFEVPVVLRPLRNEELEL